MSSQVKASMETAGLPTDNLLITRTSLPEPVQQLHRRTLHTLAQTGTPPTRGELEARAHDLRLNLDAALHQLAEAELMFVDPSGREITGGVPFAAGPTAHRVRRCPLGHHPGSLGRRSTRRRTRARRSRDACRLARCAPVARTVGRVRTRAHLQGSKAAKDPTRAQRNPVSARKQLSVGRRTMTVVDDPVTAAANAPCPGPDIPAQRRWTSRCWTLRGVSGQPAVNGGGPA